MSKGLKGLAKDTVVYGLSSIVGRFLNWLLVPMYVRVLATPGEYGIVTNLYGWTALLLALLTFGMETTYFRFANRKDEQEPMRVYANSLISVTIISALFACVGFALLQPISTWLGYAAHPEYVGMLIFIVAIDAIMSLPFARLRCEEKAWKFAGIKLANIGLNIALNIFFLIVCPIIHKHSPESIAWFYRPDYGVGYILVSNVITSIANVAMLNRELRGFAYRIDMQRLRPMLVYAIPILGISIAGILNQSVDKILFPLLFADKAEATTQLGIYGACFKIAVVMVMFIQAYRYAIEPYIFKRSKESDDKSSNAITTLYFTIFALLIYLGVSFYLDDVFKYLVSPAYYEGLKVVPIVMAGEFLFGLYFNVSFWFKLNDQTYWGTLFTIIGCVLTIAIIVIFVPLYGYMACAWATVVCNSVMLLMSYLIGRKRYPVPYPVRKMTGYVALAALLFALGMMLPIEATVLRLLWRTSLLCIYIGIVAKSEGLLSRIKK
ncbi:MAG: oligosaccharide flippase family protein [Bacteroidaceae bacterium]|nr:oligosaccharide flippase family protein [Bacteroidaceae bacterium]